MSIKKNLKWDNYQLEGLPKPIWGGEVPKKYRLGCASCGSSNIYYSGSPSDPEEILRETVRCGDCGWMTDWYEAYKAGKKAVVANLRWISYLKEYESFTSLLEYSPDAKLLDLGCGNGSFTLKYALKIDTSNITGIDLRNWEVPFGFTKGDIEVGLPFKDESFDVVTATHIIEHLSKTDLFIREIYRILKKGGYTLIATPNLASGRVILELLLNRQPSSAHVSDLFILRGDPGQEWKKSVGHLHKRLFTLEGLDRLLTYYHFKVEKKIGVGYGPFFFAGILRGKYAADLIVKARKV